MVTHFHPNVTQPSGHGPILFVTGWVRIRQTLSGSGIKTHFSNDSQQYCLRLKNYIFEYKLVYMYSRMYDMFMWFYIKDRIEISELVIEICTFCVREREKI